MRQKIATLPLMALALFFMACAGSDGNTDAGTDPTDASNGLDPCVDDSDCSSPETCEEDGYCRYVPGPKPDVNRLNGLFNLELNGSSGAALVTGKIDGKSIYMEDAWVEYFPEDDSHINIYLYGILTNNLYRILLIQVDPNSQLNTEIGLGADGPGMGAVELLEVYDDGSTKSQTSVAEVIGGNIVFSSFSTTDDDEIKGTFTVEVRPVDGI